MGSRLRIDLRQEGGGTSTLLVTGELDLATAPTLEGAVTRLCGDGARRVVIDLSRLEFIDASGLHAVSAARESCQRSACEFGLVPGRSQLRRLLRMSGMGDGIAFGESQGGESYGSGPLPTEDLAGDSYLG